MKFEWFSAIYKQNCNNCYVLRRQLIFVLALVQMKMLAFSLLQFYDAANTAKKKTFTQADRNSFTSMVAIIAINALKIQKQMRLKLAKNQEHPASTKNLLVLNFKKRLLSSNINFNFWNF